jgi:hypothetical protein
MCGELADEEQEKFASGVAQRPQSIGAFAFFVRRDRPPLDGELL